MSTLEVRACCNSTINQLHADDCKGRLRADDYFGPYEPTHTEKLLERIAVALEKNAQIGEEMLKLERAIVEDELGEPTDRDSYRYHNFPALTHQSRNAPLPVPEDTHAPGTTRETWYAPVPEYVNVLTGEDGQLHQRCLHSWWRAGASGRVRCDGAQGHAGGHIHNS